MSQSNASNASALNSPRNPPRNRHANGGQGMNWIRAEKRLAAANTENIDWARAEAAMRRSLMRTQVAGR